MTTLTKPSSHVNIDGDVLRYACGFAAEGEPDSHLFSTLRAKVKAITAAAKAETYTVLLTRDGNFREEVATLQPYKGNRNTRKPHNYHEATEYLAMHHNGWFVDGEEADDQLGIRAVRDGHTIATIDKDLDNVPGWHYNWQRDKLYFVDFKQAMTHFYIQMLTGDATDNIPGLYRLTGRRATKPLKRAVLECHTERQMWSHVAMTYNEHADEDWYTVRDWLIEIGQLLWIRHYENQMWVPPMAGFDCEDLT